MMHRKTTTIALSLMTLALLASTTSAHTGVKVGDEYEIRIGWLEEPPIADQPNAVLLRVTKATSQDMSGMQHDGMEKADEGSMDHGSMEMDDDGTMDHGSMGQDDSPMGAGPAYGSFDEALGSEGKTFTNGGLSLKLLSPEDPNAAAVGTLPFTFLLYDTDAQAPVTDASVGIETWMAPHDGMSGHGTGAQEDPTHDAHGVYRGTANYAMAGWWWTWVNGTAPAFGDFSFQIDVHALTPDGDAAMSDDAVSGIANALKVTLQIAGKQTTLSFEESDDEPGTYLAKVMPTVPGVYNATFSGDINGVPLDVSRDLQRVEPPSTIAFPEAPGTLYDVNQRMDGFEQALEALQAKQAAQAQTPADVKDTGNDVPLSPALALAAVGFAGLVWTNRHRRS